MMRIIAIIGGLLVLILAALLFIVPSLVPDDVYRTRIQEQLTTELKRDVRLDGDLSLSTFPLIKARVEDVSVANPEGFSSDTFITLDRLDARIRLLPLLSRRVEISRFTLVRPDILLERREDGAVNWALGDEDTSLQEDTPEGPFKRDGRYTNFDPNIRAFTIENGRLLYIDRIAEVEHRLEEMSLFLSLPSLSSELEVDGGLTLNERPLTVDVRMDNLRDFLNGQAATLVGSLETGDNALSLTGDIPAGEDVAFMGDVTSRLNDLTSLTEFLPDVEIPDAIQSVTVNGFIDIMPNRYRMTNGDISVEGDGIDMTYNGDAVYTDAISGTGQVEANIDSIQAFRSYFPDDVTGLDQLRSVKVSARLDGNSATGVTQFNDVDASVRGDDFSATFAGSGQYAEDVSLSGVFSADADNIERLAKIFAPDITDLSAVGAGTLEGAITLAGDQLTMTDVIASTQSDVLTTGFTGGLSGSLDAPDITGTMNVRINDLSALDAALDEDIPYSDAIGSIQFSSDVAGPVTNISLSNVVAELSDGLLNGRYAGSATLGDDISLSGRLDVSGASLRALAAQTGTTLPPSTDAGQIFEPFAMGGDLSGNLDVITLENASLTLDDLRSSGEFSLAMVGERPELIGSLAAEELDFRPYMAAWSAQAPTGGIQPWSNDPIPLEPFRALDADLTINTDAIKMTRLSLGETRLVVTLESGLLSVNAPTLSLYGGQGNAFMSFDASQPIPTFSAKATLDSLNSQSFLAAVSGFTRASGEGATLLDITGAGRSQAELMQSLDGTGSLSLLNGQITGIDATEFLSGVQQAFTSRQLPGGIGNGKVTQFRDLLGRFTLQDGRAGIESFALQGAGFEVQGDGFVDIGEQTFDFRFRPRSVGDSASGLAAFGIPLRFNGDFGGGSVGLDSQFLGEVIEARARSEVQSVIDRQVGGQAGSVIGSIIGGNNRQTTQENEEDATGSERPAQESAGRLIEGLFGQRTSSEQDSPQEDESETQEADEPDEDEEPTLENALKGLFGGKSDD